VGRRIEVELTSTREDGSWTWRAAGAKQPKGELSGDLLYTGAKVGDVVKVEADFHIDGIEVIEVFAPKAKKERSDLLELKSRPLRDDELVTTQRVARGRGGNNRGRRGDRPNRDGRDRRDRRGDTARSTRPDRPQRPKPKRLRPKRVHRDALLASVPEEHRPIVEQVVRDGMPGVRAAIEKQNAEAKAADKPAIESAPVLAIAEKHLTPARLAEWRDRADAALTDIDEVDLRDLRSVVVVGNDVARDDESRAISDQLKTALDSRMERDHDQWLSDLRIAVTDGRVVRALRLSSRPVKAGAPLPTELAGELSRQAALALAADVEPSRWAVVLDALAFSPVRSAVTPAGIPAEPGDELIDEVKRLSDRVPAIAALFGIDPTAVPKRMKRRRPGRPDGGQGKPGGKKNQPRRDNKAGDAAKKGAKSEKKASESKPEPAAGSGEPTQETQAPETVDVSESSDAPDAAAEVTDLSEGAAATPNEPVSGEDVKVEAAEEPAAEPTVESPVEPVSGEDVKVEAAEEPGAEPTVESPVEPVESSAPASKEDADDPSQAEGESDSKDSLGDEEE